MRSSRASLEAVRDLLERTSSSFAQIGLVDLSSSVRGSLRCATIASTAQGYGAPRRSTAWRQRCPANRRSGPLSFLIGSCSSQFRGDCCGRRVLVRRDQKILDAPGSGAYASPHVPQDGESCSTRRSSAGPSRICSTSSAGIGNCSGAAFLRTVDFSRHLGLRVRLAGSRIRKCGFCWIRCIHMLAQRGVADRVAPVDQPLLQLVVQPLQPRRRLRQPIVRSSGQGSASRQLVVRDVGADAPIGALAFAPFDLNESITCRLRSERTWLSIRLSTR